VAITGEQGTEKLLILSQVILSLQLSFAVIPLVMVSRAAGRRWSEFVKQALGAGTGRGPQPAVILVLNGWLLVQATHGDSYKSFDRSRHLLRTLHAPRRRLVSVTMRPMQDSLGNGACQTCDRATSERFGVPAPSLMRAGRKPVDRLSAG